MPSSIRFSVAVNPSLVPADKGHPEWGSSPSDSLPCFNHMHHLVIVKYDTVWLPYTMSKSTRMFTGLTPNKICILIYACSLTAIVDFIDNLVNSENHASNTEYLYMQVAFFHVHVMHLVQLYVHVLFISLPEPKAQGELIVWDSSRRPSVRQSTLSNINISETSRPIIIKFHQEHHWGGGLSALGFG